MQDRLLSVKDRCQRYRVEAYLPATLLPSLPQSFFAGQASDSAANSPQRQGLETTSFFTDTLSPPPPRMHQQPSASMMMSSTAVHTAGSSKFPPSSLAATNIPPNASQADLLALIADLQSALTAAEEEIDDLEVDLLESAKAKDQTPAAILFFSLMHDPAFVPNLQQLVLQFRQLKSFMDYTAHVDYMTLRKRLQVCLVLMPSVEKLLDKYSLMHRAWAQVRLNWFAERKLRGGTADALAYCPLCFHNLEERDDPLAADKNSSGKLRGGAGREEAMSPRRSQSSRRVRQERLKVKSARQRLVQAATAAATNMAQSVSLPALPAAALPISSSQRR